MSYDLRNDQEASVMARRHTRDAHRSVQMSETSVDDANASCPMFGPDGKRWMCLAGLGLIGLGVGFRLGKDQFTRNA